MHDKDLVPNFNPEITEHSPEYKIQLLENLILMQFWEDKGF